MAVCSTDARGRARNTRASRPTSDPKKWSDSLTNDEFKATEFYKGNGFKATNKALRSRSVPAKLKTRVAALDSAIEKGMLGKNTVLRRVAQDKDFPNLKVGSEFMDRGFVSTTYKPRASGVGNYSRGKKPIIFEIQGKRGQVGAYPDAIVRKSKNLFSTLASEGEFILPRNTRFRVIEITERAGQRKVKLVIV